MLAAALAVIPIGGPTATTILAAALVVVILFWQMRRAQRIASAKAPENVGAEHPENAAPPVAMAPAKGMSN